MQTMAGPQRRGAGQGFTLIELLLATVLLLLLINAAVFSFSSLQRGSELEEGTAQFESLLRYARAHAANTGRQVQIFFEDENDPDMPGPPASVQVTWEPDPLGQPGVFEALAIAEPFVQEINRLVQVQSVSVSDPASNPVSTSAAGEMADEATALEDFVDLLPSIRIYPDGSSDSAEIVLSSLADDDLRMMRVRLVGITGAIRHKLHGGFESNEPTGESVQNTPAPGAAADNRSSAAFESPGPVDAVKLGTADSTGVPRPAR